MECTAHDLYRNELIFQNASFPLFSVAERHAKRRLLSFHDREDCVLEFVEVMLFEKRAALEMQQQSHCFDAWLHRCAHNHVEDYCRRLARVRQHEIDWPQQQNEEGDSLICELVSREEASHALLLRQELTHKILMAAERLKSEPHTLFLRYYLHGETLSELSTATGRTPDAVGKVLKRACASIRAALARQGMTEADVAEYLVEMRKRGGGKCCHEMHKTDQSYVKFNLSQKLPVGFLPQLSL